MNRLNISNLEIRLEECIINLTTNLANRILGISGNIKFLDNKELFFTKHFEDIAELKSIIHRLSNDITSNSTNTETNIIKDIIIHGNYVDMTSDLLVKNKLVMLTIAENRKIPLTKSIIDTNILLTKLHDYLTILIGEL